MKKGDKWIQEGFQIWTERQDGQAFGLPTYYRSVKELKEFFKAFYKKVIHGVEVGSVSKEPKRFIVKVHRTYEVVEILK